MADQDKKTEHNEAEQTALNRSDISIENDVATWTIKDEGAILGTYHGTFKFRCYLTPVQQLNAGRDARAALGENSILADQHETFLAFALSQLKQRVISAPPFWYGDDSKVPGDIPDEDILTKILDAAINAEVKYKVQLKDRKRLALEKARKAAEAMLNNRPDEDKSDDETE